MLVGSRPTKAAIGFGAIWVTHFSDNRVSRIDLATHTIRQTIVVGSGPSGVAAGGGAVWWRTASTGPFPGSIPSEKAVVQTIAVGNDPSGIAFGNSRGLGREYQRPHDLPHRPGPRAGHGGISGGR